MTRNSNINPTSLAKTYDNPQASWQRLLIALWHPDYREQNVLTSLHDLREHGYEEQ